jgi:NADP-dependent 3-hydroxy acid dehydrogenase YdfG
MKNPKNILITGASSGIGEALAVYYTAPGVTLCLNGRNAERLEAVAALCRDKGAEVQCNVMNVTDQSAMAAWVEEMDNTHPLDLVIANAGISGGTGGVMNGEDPVQVRKIFDVNVNGVFNTIEPILPRMMARKKGQVAIMSSLAAFRGWPGAPAYSASKGAVRFYGEALRGAMAHTGVKINVICPGFVTSRMTDANDFPMPFKMPAAKAAHIIACGLARDKGRIAFPWPTHIVSWLMSVIPDAAAQKILVRLPRKPAN